MYVRFEGRRGGGLFQLGDGFEWSMRRKLARRDAREFARLKHWLWTNTPLPPEEAYRDSRARWPRTWFKESAAAHVRSAWEMIDLMARYGVRLRPLRSRDPGVVLWEDEVQAVVRAHRVGSVPRARRPGARAEAWDRDRRTIRQWRADGESARRAEVVIGMCGALVRAAETAPGSPGGR